MTATLRALSVGPAASRALSMPGAAVRLHSLFASTANLAVERAAILVALTGPSGARYPHAVALEGVSDFPTLPVSTGDAGRLHADGIHLHGQHGDLLVSLRHACRPRPRVLPLIDRTGDALRAAARRLDDIQSRSVFDLRFSSLLGGPAAGSSVAAALSRSARALCGARPGPGLSRAVSALVGAGAGLTPSGDDFLSGLMAASRASGDAALTRALGDAVQRNLAATGDVSASLLLCAVDGYWPDPLVDLADALAVDNASAAVDAVDGLCGMGHSSGSDIATGFLFGLATVRTAST